MFAAERETIEAKQLSFWTRNCRRRLPAFLALAGLLALTGCGPSSTPDGAASGNSDGALARSDVSAGRDNTGSAGESASLVQLRISEPVTYKVMPKLDEESAARVTINSLTYTPGADFDQFKPKDSITRDGLLVVNLTWETMAGRTQSNDAYMKVVSADGSEGVRLVQNVKDKLKNGRVALDEPRTGNFAFAIKQGVNIIILINESADPVAELTFETKNL